MVARKFVVQHGDSAFDIDYDTDDGFEVLKFQLFSLTSIPPAEQKIWGGDNDRVVLDDSDLDLISDKLKLASIDDSKESKEMEKPAVDFEKSDEELARMLQAEEDELMMQHFISSENTAQVEKKIRPCVDQVLMYEELHRQEAARKTVPVDKLEEKAEVALAREGNFSPTKDELDHAFLLQLLFWFKQSFRWVNAPPCDSCNKDTINQGMGAANHLELQFRASRVEIYCCKSCSTITRFPRYNDPMKLLETRKGRCGEWANCFTLYCRAFGYDSRLILDFTDHVWTECFSPFLGRWMHLDPCEGIYDNPLLYEKGWNKKLSYVFALSRNGVYDVTKRYTRKWREVLSRRVLTTEPTLAAILSNITGELRRNLASEMRLKLDDNNESEAEELERNLFSIDNASVSLPGRQSGDKAWRLSRAEFVSDDHCSMSSSSCPVRRCVDEHVTKIYNAFSPVIYQLVEHASNKFRATEILETFKRILVSLKNSSFRSRRTKINPLSTNSLFCKMIPSFGQLFDALSLKTEAVVDGTTDLYLASDPVKTSLALPVIFHALDDLIHNVNNCETLNKSLHWPLLKLNRICSGFVLASGEELPFGVATSAFDGTRMSNWEQPNGATGCWIMYKTFDNQRHELVAYELMSANDAPERDPKDWVIEGSADGGTSWNILDKQTSQEFDKRYQRKTYEIRSSPTLLANAFRFRFIAVRDAKSTSRFKIGSIDLYARTDTISGVR